MWEKAISANAECASIVIFITKTALISDVLSSAEDGFLQQKKPVAASELTAEEVQEILTMPVSIPKVWLNIDLWEVNKYGTFQQKT